MTSAIRGGVGPSSTTDSTSSKDGNPSSAAGDCRTVFAISDVSKTLGPQGKKPETARALQSSDSPVQ